MVRNIWGISKANIAYLSDADIDISTNQGSRYSLSAATFIMLWMVAKKQPSGIARRVRQSKEW